MKRMTIPFFSLDRQTQLLKQEILARFESLIESQQFIGGPYITSIEQELAAYLGVKHVIACNSGTDALWLAVKALNVQPGDIVLTTPFSFIASSSELIPHGARPVFIDCEEHSFNICVATLEQWLTTETHRVDNKTIHNTTGSPVVGIIPVHLFGQCVNYAALEQVAKKYNLWIIEDTAQAIGSTYNNYKAGTMGDIGTFSFYPTKNLGAFGDAGCCATNDTELAEKLIRLRNHGRKSHYHYEGYGLNSRMDALQAVVISSKLRHIETYNKKRRQHADYYKQRLQHLTYLQLPQEIYGTHTYHQYSVLVAKNSPLDRDALAAYLADKGIETRVFYPQSLQDINYLNTDSRIQTDCPIAQRFCSSILSLPIWPELTVEELSYICDTLEEIQTTLATPEQQPRVLNG